MAKLTREEVSCAMVLKDKGQSVRGIAKALTGSYLEAASGKSKPIVRAGSKIGRNDPCPCGSGKKYKKCCLGE